MAIVVQLLCRILSSSLAIRRKTREQGEKTDFGPGSDSLEPVCQGKAIIAIYLCCELALAAACNLSFNFWRVWLFHYRLPESLFQILP